MMKTLIKFTLNTLFILSLITTSGCVPLLIGAAVGAGGITYARGALEQNTVESVTKVHKASLKALKSFGLFITSDELNKHSAIITAEYKDGRKVKINIQALTEFVSKITIRIGAFGDKEESQAILNAIEKKL